MSCYHPLKAFQIGVNENGKRKLKVVPFEVDHLFFDDGVWKPSPFESFDKKHPLELHDYIMIPCGKCAGCRVDYSRQWANRLLLELQEYDPEKCFFLTLTYADDGLTDGVKRFYGDPVTGEAQPCLSLCKKDLQDFFKRLRYYYPTANIRYFACGEYGSQTRRPHYHAIVFDLPLDRSKFVFHERSSIGHVYYRQQHLEEVIWQHGLVAIGDVTWSSCAYTARYVTKKLNGPASQFYTDFNIDPEFCVMSRRPGIASHFYEEHKDDLIKYQFINVSTPDGGRKFVNPKYFMQKLDLDFPDEYGKLKEQRLEFAKEKMNGRVAKEHMTVLELLESDEENFKRRIESLKRERTSHNL